MDEQCIADIAASIIGGQIIDRSKDALDEVYRSGSVEGSRLTSALDVYGGDRFKIEFKFCIDELLEVCNADGSQKLRGILFKNYTTNPFPAVFAVLMIAFHEALISNHSRVKSSITDLADRIDTSRKSTNPEERRKNVDTIKGLIASSLVDGSPVQYGASHSSVDVEAIIRRSEIEVPHYELKQGLPGGLQHRDRDGIGCE